MPDLTVEYSPEHFERMNIILLCRPCIVPLIISSYYTSYVNHFTGVLKARTLSRRPHI